MVLLRLSNTELWALCFVQDPELHPIMSSHGLVQFLQLIGITEAEYKFLKHQRISMEELLTELSRENPLLVTDLYRKSLIK